MVHGPCGIINPNAPCMKDGECSKQFPKAFREETEENVNGYPVYKRRCTEPVRAGKHYIDNRWIVPYNPWLSKKYNAHINVEVCASVKSVKYLYKYVYKGHDAASITLKNDDSVNHDEILNFLDGRYVSAPEVMWRLSEFSRSDKSHTVIRLAVHLPEQQAIFLKERQENEAVERASIKDTTLTAWFKLNLIDEEAHEYYYADIPQYYVFDKPSTKWQKRQRGGQQVIGRMPVVSVQDSERFYLRMLLLRKTGVISFNDLKTIDGTLCETFQESCKVLGLLDGDQHWHDTLLIAARMQLPSYLRILFAIICGFGEVENIPDLWTQHKQSLSEDFVHRYSEETGPFYALAELNELLKSYDLNLRKVNLLSVDLQCDLFRLSYDAMEEQSKANANIEKLNSEQRYAVYKVLHAIYEYQTDTPKCFFLDGPAGTGKTFVYSLLHAVRGKGDQGIAVASTGIAATLLSGGRTAHSIFKIPLTLNATSTCNLKPNTSEAKILLDAKVIVWDEAPMTYVHAFLAVDRLLKDLTKCDEPFGGKIILLGGDFRQVLQVILRGSRSLTVSSCIKKHRLCSDFFVMKLTENMRAFDSEKEFASSLLHVGEGESGEKIQLPPFCYPEIQDPVQQLFSDIDFKTVTPEELVGRAILTVTNDLSMQINNRVLECMPGNEVIYESIDNIVSNDPQDQLAYTEEFLNSLTPTGMPPHKLRLKPGAIIMLLRNLASSKCLCNGTRLIVIQLQKNVIVAKKISADNNNESYLIPRIPLIPSDSNIPFQFKRKQFPIRLAFSMTINKAQGQTFDKIRLDLTKPVFSHGQFYVGLSRVRSFDSVTVVSPNSEIYNCVYREIL
ncbi:ATP-dependent DNA helicase PIF1 [Araneus ventricosus]|uniref:ATP-dependent DNA helicase n=1 Tax=Araneus ventricosus TaxID=182803 RepID=A0A4Y2MTY6_ARAVE|nr:ATP-dependent DNA helicase PIF1 [Araneus ventricosus]